jgi:hypothetical protein
VKLVAVVAASMIGVAGFLLPRFEAAYLPTYGNAIAVASARAYLSAIASGMMTLTAIVFFVAIVMVQFRPCGSIWIIWTQSSSSRHSIRSTGRWRCRQVRRA